MRRNRRRLAFSRRTWATVAGLIPALTERGLELGIVAEYPEATEIKRLTVAVPSWLFGGWGTKNSLPVGGLSKAKGPSQSAKSR